MDLKELLKKTTYSCSWDRAEAEEFIDEVMNSKSVEELKRGIEGMLASVDYSIENEALDSGDEVFLRELQDEKKELESLIPFYAFVGFTSEREETVRAFYDLEEARQEAEFWLNDNPFGCYYIHLSITSEDDVEEILKGCSREFLDSKEEFKNPRDEYTLSFCCDADMVLNEVAYKEWN